MASLWAVASTGTSTPLQSVRTGTGGMDVKARHRSGSLSCSETLRSEQCNGDHQDLIRPSVRISTGSHYREKCRLPAAGEV